MSEPTRPRVVLTTTASVDGRVTITPSERLLDPDVSARWQSAWPGDVTDLVEQRRRWIEAAYEPTVTLEGSGTFVAAEAPSPWGDVASAGQAPSDYLPRRAPRWFVVVDSRGRVDWHDTGDDDTALLVLVCRATPAGYLARLRQLGVGYLVVGPQRVDLRVALERLGELLEVTTVVADGGGGINGALLRAGLVDEVHVITFPALVGGLATPSFVDGEVLAPGGTPVRLRSIGLVQGAEGSTWARYEVRTESTGDA
ncbi:MAG: RibD family protein [Nocardioides sp.]